MNAVVPHKLFLVALALAAALSSAGAGCRRGGQTLATPPVEAVRAPQLAAEPAPDQPGRVELEFREGDFQAPDLVVPPGEYDIVVTNVDHRDMDIGFFLRVPDKYGRETQHVPGGTGGGIRAGSSKTFHVKLDPGQAYLYSCPITGSPDHLLTAANDLPVSSGEDF